MVRRRIVLPIFTCSVFCISFRNEKVTLTRRRFRWYLQCSHPMAMKWAFIKAEGKILPKGVQVFLWKISRIIFLRAQPKLCRLGVQAAFACIFSDGLELHKRLISICTSEPYLVHVSMTQVSHFSNTQNFGKSFCDCKSLTPPPLGHVYKGKKNWKNADFFIKNARLTIWN